MSKTGIEVSLSNDMTKEIKNASDEAIEAALEAVGLQAEGYAVMICPVDTGRLRDSIAHAVDGHTVAIGTNVEYAPKIELGGSRQAPNGFLGPAIQDHIDEYKKMIEAELKK